MSSPDDPDNRDPSSLKIEIFNRVNRLKEKAGGSTGEGAGKFSASSIEKADMVIEDMASLYPKEIENMLGMLGTEWSLLRGGTQEDEKASRIERMSHMSNQIKDLAGTFGYSLMEYFGESLREYILETDLSREEHYTIVQAHIDVMEVAFKQNLKSDGGALGLELKETVKKAIEKYH